MICNYGKRAREVFEVCVYQKYQKRRKVEDDILSEFFILAAIDMSDHKENLMSTSIDGWMNEFWSNIEPPPMDIEAIAEPSLTKIDGNCIVDDCIPVRLPEQSPEEMKTKCSTECEDNPMDVNDFILPVEINTGIESVDIQSDPAFQPPLAIGLGELLWARYLNYPFWPAIVYQSDTETSQEGVKEIIFYDENIS